MALNFPNAYYLLIFISFNKIIRLKMNSIVKHRGLETRSRKLKAPSEPLFNEIDDFNLVSELREQNKVT